MSDYKGNTGPTDDYWKQMAAHGTTQQFSPEEERATDRGESDLLMLLGATNEQEVTITGLRRT